ncbi:Holliday junction branch migration protein RuvA [Candidatus Saccharibacteria bacterium]|nr:Holliday junction branch migration protein RuvA [Candidatus Saccharibacteria bacterium]MBI3338223.1 Holliday junction branch migration protein RuvA [Candidatus Saccharibacteria bacterium]
MIATLTGIIAEKLAELLIIDVKGVGFGLLVTNEDFGRLVIGDRVKVYVYEHIRENSHDLYGFSDLDSKRLFEQLLEVNGVGPKMALNMLGVGSTQAVRSAIAAGDTKFMQAASGVGKRVAERVIVELKDKVGLISAESAVDFLQGPNMEDEALQALVALGFAVSDAARALKNIDTQLSTEDRIKQALKGVSL